MENTRPKRRVYEKAVICRFVGGVHALGVRGSARAPRWRRGSGGASPGDCRAGSGALLLSQRILLLLQQQRLVLLDRAGRTLGRTAKGPLPERGQVQGQGPGPRKRPGVEMTLWPEGRDSGAYRAPEAGFLVCRRLWTISWTYGFSFRLAYDPGK